MFKFHIIALLLGTILDFFIGRIYSIPYPFDGIKKWIEYLDRALLGDDLILLEAEKQRSLGAFALMLVIVPALAVSTFFIMLCYEIWLPLGILFEAVLTYFCLEENYLYNYGKDEIARLSVRGRNTEESEIKMVISTIANDASDHVISPLFIMFLFGPVGGVLYRTLDLMDSLIGYRGARYEYFGYYTARLNKLVDYLPGRFSGALAVFSARHTFGGFNGKNARYINMRDKNKAIAAFAGAIDISLKGNTIGDDDKVAGLADINKAICLMRNMYVVCQLILVLMLVFF